MAANLKKKPMNVSIQKYTVYSTGNHTKTTIHIEHLSYSDRTEHKPLKLGNKLGRKGGLKEEHSYLAEFLAGNFLITQRFCIVF